MYLLFLRACVLCSRAEFSQEATGRYRIALKKKNADVQVGALLMSTLINISTGLRAMSARTEQYIKTEESVPPYS